MRLPPSAQAIYFPALAATLIATGATAQGQTDYETNIGPVLNFETPQVHPIALSANGTRLFAVDTPDARLSVFDSTTASNPLLLAEIPVGIEPVSVRPRTIDEVWVVNHTSDSISVISLAQGIVTDTIQCKDAPCDVVFAGTPQRAYVSVGGSRQVRVFDTTTHALVATIPIAGREPRALAVSGTKVYVAVAISGNGTTVLPAAVAPSQGASTNPSVGAAPQVGRIIDAADPQYSSQIPFTIADNDVVEINAVTNTVTRTFHGVGTLNFAIAVRPTNGDLFVANTESRNQIRFERNLRGHAIDSRIAKIDVLTGAVVNYDLNAGLDYSTPNNPAARATALSQPTDAVFTADSAFLYVAAFGTDRIAKVDAATGAVTARIDIGTSGSTPSPRTKRGPRGLALHSSGRMFVLNRLSNTITIVNTVDNTLGQEIPVGAFDPTPPLVREGRGFLYDAMLSGNGTMSCASCHVDAETDCEDWDLGDDEGPEDQRPDPSNTYGMIALHPMKGPMSTQTLRGLSQGSNPLHWRGDRSTFQDFNGAFASLMGGTQVSTVDMQAFTDFILACEFEPNPNLNLDRSLPTTLNGADPVHGLDLYQNGTATTPLGSCNSCHHLPLGTGSKIVNRVVLNQTQGLKVPQLRTAYQKVGFDNTPGASSVAGFGFGHDGAFATIEDFLSNPTTFGTLATDATAKRDLAAFVLCIDTNTPPAVGFSRTLKATTVNTAPAIADINALIALADAGQIDLIAKGRTDNQVHGFLYSPITGEFQSDQGSYGSFAWSQLVQKIQAGGTLTLMGVPEGSGQRMGIDRNMNLIPDGDESFYVLESYGRSTPTCAATIHLTSNTQPYVGNNGFAFTCTNLDPNSFALVAVAGGQGLEPGPSLLGMTIWIDPTAVLFFDMATDDLGFGYAPIAIPNNPAFIDAVLSAMVVDFHSCAPFGIAGSHGVRFDLPDAPNGG